jgi:hypothetical protein
VVLLHDVSEKKQNTVEAVHPEGLLGLNIHFIFREQEMYCVEMKESEEI